MKNSDDFLASTGASALSFFGRFRQKLDAKGRLTLPAIHRRALEGKDEWLVLRKDEEGFLQIIPSLQWQQVLAARRVKAAADSENRGRDRKWDRRLESTDVAVVPLDLKGRITVPQELLESSGIEKDAMVLGVGGHLELWNAESYLEAAKDHKVDPGEIDDLLYG
jgi:transcriptional regulator MraZ